MPSLGGVRARLTAAVVGLIVIATLALGIGVALFVDARLHAQVLEAAADQARFDLSVTVPGRQLPDQPTLDDIDRSAPRRHVPPARRGDGGRPGPGPGPVPVAQRPGRPARATPAGHARARSTVAS